jgi:abequosyltransferase
MQRRLTVAIPTFNRAALLDEQLAWFADAVAGRERHVELIVSDNCSTDETPEVIERWRRRLSGGQLEVHCYRQEENVGAIRNIAGCIGRARGAYVWTVGDDDAIDGGAVRFVLDTIAQHRDLSLLILNYSNRHWQTKQLRFERCFEVDADLVEPHGQGIVERFLRDPDPSRWGGLVLTTALVYRTDAAQGSLAAWPAGVDNLCVQLFVTAWCALAGATVLTRDAHLEMASGRHFFADDRMMFFRFRIGDIPMTFVKLAQIGYEPGLCLERVRTQRREFRWRVAFRLFMRSPMATTRVLLDHLAASSRLADAVRGRGAALPPIRSPRERWADAGREAAF